MGVLPAGRPEPCMGKVGKLFMAILAVCPNPDCGADIMIPRRIGARVVCEECEMEWEVEDYDPVELVPIEDAELWDTEAEDDDLDLGVPAGKSAAAPLRETASAAAGSQWECQQCGTIHMGLRPPRVCPGCGAGSDEFMMLGDEDTDLVVDDLDDEAL